jgi:hypothetical protein
MTVKGSRIRRSPTELRPGLNIPTHRSGPGLTRSKMSTNAKADATLTKQIATKMII